MKPVAWKKSGSSIRPSVPVIVPATGVAPTMPQVRAATAPESYPKIIAVFSSVPSGPIFDQARMWSGAPSTRWASVTG